MNISILSQKLIILCGLFNKYCCLLLSLSWHMRRKRQYYQHGLKQEKKNVWCKDQEISQTLLGKGLKEREI